MKKIILPIVAAVCAAVSVVGMFFVSGFVKSGLPRVSELVGVALGLTAAVGSLAGDDTVFCAFKEDEDAVTALQELQQKISTGLEVKKTRRRRSAAGTADIEPAE